MCVRERDAGLLPPFVYKVIRFSLEVAVSIVSPSSFGLVGRISNYFHAEMASSASLPLGLASTACGSSAGFVDVGPVVWP